MWRAGNSVVIDINNIQGDRCLWTNEFVGEKRCVVEIQTMKNVPSVADELGVMNRRLSKPIQFHTLKLRLPVSPSWQGQEKEARKRLGKTILFFSAGLSILGLGLYFAETTISPKNPSIPMLIFSAICAGSGIPGILVGFAWPYLEGVPGRGGYVWGKWFHDPYVWIEPIHPKVLETLPPWTGISVQESQAMRPGADTIKQSVTTVAISLAVLVVVVIVRVLVKMMVRDALH